jgi:hypothetical protein
MVVGYFHAAATLSLDNHWKYVGRWIGSRIGLNTCRRDEFLARAGNRTEMCPTMYLCASYGYLNKKWVGLLLQTSLTGFSLQLRALMKPGGGHSWDLSSKKLLLLMKIRTIYFTKPVWQRSLLYIVHMHHCKYYFFYLVLSKYEYYWTRILDTGQDTVHEKRLVLYDQTHYWISCGH